MVEIMNAVQSNSIKFKIIRNQTAWVIGYLIGRTYEILKLIILVSAKIFCQIGVGLFRLVFGWLEFFMRSPIVACIFLGVFIAGGITVLEKVGVYFDSKPHSASAKVPRKRL